MNKFKNTYCYCIRLKKRKIISLEKKDKKGKMVRIKKFKRPVTENKLPKIYVIKDKSNAVYVGVTSQSIRNRLRYGLESRGKGGYHGYQFKDLDKINLFVFCFNKTDARRIEGIEAEIVYLIRNKTGDWPKYQTEIHFHKTAGRERRTARSIYEIVK